MSDLLKPIHCVAEVVSTYPTIRYELCCTGRETIYLHSLFIRFEKCER